MKNIPKGLNYVKLVRKVGVLVNYYIVLKDTMVGDGFYLIDDFIQANIKNFGQAPTEISGEVYIFQLKEARSVFDMCHDFEIVPISIDGVPYNGDALLIEFDDIVAMLPSGKGEWTKIYATTNPIERQTPVVYEVGFTVDELWDYIDKCAMPSI